MNKITVVYVTDNTKNFGDMLLRSIESLRENNKEVKIKIINTGTKLDIPNYCYPCEQITVKGYFQKFPDDKYLICNIPEENILYLDSDTFVKGNIDDIVNFEEDFAARESWTFQNKTNWDLNYKDKWSLNLKICDIEFIPVFNSGVMMFKNNLHRKIKETWKNYLIDFYSNKLIPVYGGNRLFEQLALSLAVGKNNVPYSLLDSKQHSYAWNNELSNETIIFHTTSKLYKDFSKCFI